MSGSTLLLWVSENCWAEIFFHQNIFDKRDSKVYMCIWIYTSVKFNRTRWAEAVFYCGSVRTTRTSNDSPTNSRQRRWGTSILSIFQFCWKKQDFRWRGQIFTVKRKYFFTKIIFLIKETAIILAITIYYLAEIFFNVIRIIFLIKETTTNIKI